VQKLNAGAAAIRPLAFQGALGRAAPTRLCGVDGRDVQRARRCSPRRAAWRSHDCRRVKGHLRAARR
jgi:hypothetical protein